MKSVFVITALAWIVAATPIPNPGLAIDLEEVASVEARRVVGITADEFKQGGCRDVIWFFARGSTEAGNMGTIVGPPTASALKRVLGSDNVAIQGIDYPALVSTNLLPGGADLGGIREMASLLTQAANDCPNSSILAGGYSQGAALTHRAIENLPDNVKNAIDGVVTFGDTKNLQDRGQIPNFPREKVRIFCNRGDLVCSGTLTITAAHLTYGNDAEEAAAFLAGRVNAAA
ncbi:uncharacterized protein HMPREF1541_07065 [Cyphellophora europaea CBS 101466]|uniref:cutinase n=1 Tax=Cyphellophora europaea (strain CBS 101466) TaxID=1220924 RepID=W2RTF9_CYPE1|nr:uncharacterized protein HMPREF1541_07065 [Cyphellophora europaea CBS 101466]ETN39023.1 hypothetical protein HMPREF1541_07065 [Cyphellophora europaea CBS 101466]